MTKADWANIFLYLHFLGFGMIMSLPVTALVLQRDMNKRNFPVVAQIGVFLGRMDRIALYGAVVLLVTGIGQMWALNISVGSLFGGQYTWLLAKVILFAILLVNGAALAGPGIRRRVQLLTQIGGQKPPDPNADQENQLVSTANFMRNSGIPQIVLLIAILFLVSFGYVFKP